MLNEELRAHSFIQAQRASPMGQGLRFSLLPLPSGERVPAVSQTQDGASRHEF